MLMLPALSPGQFLHSRRISVAEDAAPALPTSRKPSEALYQSQWDERLTGGWEDEEESHFCMLLESLGASNVFQEWVELTTPHIITYFITIQYYICNITILHLVCIPQISLFGVVASSWKVWG